MNRQPDIADTAGNGYGKTARAGSGTAGIQSAVSASPRSGEFQNFVTDIESLITSMTSLTGADLDRAKEKLAERVSAAKQSLTETGTAIAERARQSARATNDYVHGHPWQAVGMGAILGLLVGIAVSRRD